MRWNRGHRSRNVEVRRGGSAGSSIGALLPIAMRMGPVGVILLIGGYFALQYFGGGTGEQHSATSSEPPSEEVSFVSFVFDDAQDTWTRLFEGRGQRYREARMVIYQGGTTTRCGYGNSAIGPFYCPGDQTVYIDLSFYRQLKSRLGAPGDFAQAYVIAHEIGHHVQHQLDELGGPRDRGKGSNSVAQELQADCYAGVWAASTRDRELIERGDFEEAMGAAEAIGDDALQRQGGGAVQPESWTHGSSEQRKAAFRRGFQSGDPAACAR